MVLVLALAPLFAGFVRKTKAHLLRRQGPPLIQPYREVLRLLRKDVVLADSASWVFRVAPYLVFATTWVAAALVPTFATGLVFSYAADVIAIVALLAKAAAVGVIVAVIDDSFAKLRLFKITEYASAAFLLAVTIVVLLVRSGLRSGTTSTPRPPVNSLPTVTKSCVL